VIDSIKIQNLIYDSSEVYITAHKNIDLDALGSVLGMYYVIKNCGKSVTIIIDDEKVNPEVKRSLDTIKKLDNIIPVRYDDIKRKLNDKSLLIITDTNKCKRLQNEQLKKLKRKIVIDHHVRTDDTIDDAIYEYIDVTSSSACEIVLDLIDELNIYIPDKIATIMLAGIYIDTNGFLLKTTEKTHICTSILYKFGADNIEAQYLLKQNYNEFKRRQDLTLSTEFYDNIAISTSNNKYLTTELAKASDVTLTFNGVEASFSIARLNDDTIGISARSLGNIDVEEIMTHFNGGGHKTDAATQIKGVDVEKVKKELLEYLGGLNEGNIY